MIKLDLQMRSVFANSVASISSLTWPDLFSIECLSIRDYKHLLQIGLESFIYLTCLSTPLQRKGLSMQDQSQNWLHSYIHPVIDCYITRLVVMG